MQKEKDMNYSPTAEDLAHFERMAKEKEGRVVENPIIKDKATFLKSTEDTNGEYLLAKLEVAPGGGNPMHYHVTFTEKFTVMDGQLSVSLNGEEKILNVGESAFVPKLARHRFYNTSDTYVTALIELRPARNFENGIRILYGLARDGEVNAKALPKSIWHFALICQYLESYTPGLPLPLQRGIFSTLAGIAKLLGKDKELEKYVA
jgi:quercetin dioxygenase-like cupin family protein